MTAFSRIHPFPTLVKLDPKNLEIFHSRRVVSFEGGLEEVSSGWLHNMSDFSTPRKLRLSVYLYKSEEIAKIDE